MSDTRMKDALTQSLQIAAVGLIIQNLLVDSTFSYAANSKLFTDFVEMGMLFANATLNETIPTNVTLGSEPSGGSDADAYGIIAFWESFVKPLVITAMLAPVQYKWQMWLEKKFPSRPPVYVLVSDEKGNRVGEEKMVLTEVKSERTPLSYANILLKWLVEMTIGGFWRRGASLLLDDVVLGVSLERLLLENIFWTFMNIVLQCFFSWFSFRPLATLLSFIIVPAHKRVVFMAGFEAFWKILWALFFRTLLPWVENLDFVQGMMSNVTEELRKQAETGPNEARLIDEL